MLTVRKEIFVIYVDRASGQWIVRDMDGNMWILPLTENPWNDRQPFSSADAEEAELEHVPGHYRHMLGLPN